MQVRRSLYSSSLTLPIPPCPFVADTVLTDSMVAPDWAAQIVRVIKLWGVKVAHLVSDNENLMEATARIAGLTRIPCLSHIGNLLYKAIMSAFETPDFIKNIHALYSRSKGRAATFRRNRVSPSIFVCPSHRFSTHADALAFLATPQGWQATRRAVRAVRVSIAEASDKDLPAALRNSEEQLASPLCRASVIIAHDMLHPLSILIAESESHVTPPDLAARLTALMSRIQRMHDETEGYAEEVRCFVHFVTPNFT